MTRIKTISTHLPEYSFDQTQLAAWFGKHFDQVSGRKLRHLMKGSEIVKKRAVIPDFGDVGNAEQLYRNNGAGIKWPGLQERMDIYNTTATEMGRQAGIKCLDEAGITPSEITHFIAVTCTGLHAPGLDITIPEKINLPADIERYAVNFMGCYAAFHAFKIADRICKTEANSNVLIICTETCSLHFKNDHADDNLLATSLFSDGAAAALLQPGKNATGWVPLVLHSRILKEGRNDMGWNIGNDRFEMTLTSAIARHIMQHLPSFVEKMIRQSGLTTGDIDYYAIHPGGKIILKAAAKSINAKPEQTAACFEVLHKYGNMSSPSILFVMKELETTINKNPGTEPIYIPAIAFGPGLTIEGALFRFVGNGEN